MSNNTIETYTKKRTFIYLGGNISQDDRTYLWREKITDMFSKEPRVILVDPCKNKFNQSVRNPDGKDIKGLEFMKSAYALSQNILKPKDFTMIKMCSVAIMNFEVVSEGKPMIGTLFETCWCEYIFKIPIIGIFGTKEARENNPYANHPWILSACNAQVETEEDAANIIKTFFLDY